MLVSCSNSFNCAHNQKVHFDFTRFVKKETNCNHFLKCQLEKYFLPTAKDWCFVRKNYRTICTWPILSHIPSYKGNTGSSKIIYQDFN